MKLLNSGLIVRDHFELIDFAVYLLGMGLLLPAVALLERDSLWSMGLLIALLLPIPAYVIRMRYCLPASLDAALEKYAYLMFFLGFLCLVGSVALVISRRFISE